MKKIVLTILSVLVTSTVFGVRISAMENPTSGSLLSRYSDEYLDDVGYLADRIIEHDGVYILDVDETTFHNKELLQDMTEIVQALNDAENIEILHDKTINVHDTKTSDNGEPTISEFGFGNWYWWGYAYTLVKEDLEWIAKRLSAIGAVAALARYIPEPTWTKAVAVAGTVLSAVGGVFILIQLASLTFSVIYGGMLWVNPVW